MLLSRRKSVEKNSTHKKIFNDVCTVYFREWWVLILQGFPSNLSCSFSNQASIYSFPTLYTLSETVWIDSTMRPTNPKQPSVITKSPETHQSIPWCPCYLIPQCPGCLSHNALTILLSSNWLWRFQGGCQLDDLSTIWGQERVEQVVVCCKKKREIKVELNDGTSSGQPFCLIICPYTIVKFLTHFVNKIMKFTNTFPVLYIIKKINHNYTYSLIIITFLTKSS